MKYLSTYKAFIFLIFATVLTACQTTSHIAPNYTGSRVNPISLQSVTLEKIQSNEKYMQRCEALGKQGYTFLGKALFTGLQDGPSEIKKFAASVGADCVVSQVILVGSTTQSYMGMDSFTPGQTITSLSRATSYGTGVTTGSFTTPSGPMGYNSQTTGTAYGTGTSTTYIPPQATYSTKYYEVPITSQAYTFWLSPQGYLLNWETEWKKGWEKANSSRAVPLPATDEVMKNGAMYFAQAWNLVLPQNLRPKNPLRDLSEEERKIYREKWVSNVPAKKP